MSSDEKLQQALKGSSGVPPQRATDWIEHTGDRGGVPPIPRLVLLALTIILVGTAAGLAAALVLPKTYGARAEILSTASQDPQGGGDPLKQDRQISTQLVMLKSRAVLGPIAQKQGRQFDDLDNDVSAQVLNNSSVIEVDAHGSSDQAALQTLQAVISGYLAVASQPSGVARNLGTQLADTRENTARLQTQVQQLTTAVTAGKTTQASLDSARAQLTASLDQEKALQTRIDQVNLTGETGPDAQVLTPPYALPDPVFPQPAIAAGTGALVGLVVAGVLVAIVTQRRTSSTSA